MDTKYLLFSLLSLITSITHTDFRDYPEHKDCPIAQFYYENHTKQTLIFVLRKKQEYIGVCRRKMGIWQALEYLNELIDESDPDLDLPQIQHALQTAEAIRKDGHPRWLVLTGLIHDLGKILFYFGEPQWAVVGDTFPVGCAYADKVIYHDFFKDNPDYHNELLNTRFGIYKPNCGLENVHISWGHDEYLYQVIKKYVPAEAAYIIRYHSFYAQHQHNAYDHLLSEYDRRMFEWVKLFQTYDLYSKDPHGLDVDTLKPYYQELIDEFFPEQLDW